MIYSGIKSDDSIRKAYKCIFQGEVEVTSNTTFKCFWSSKSWSFILVFNDTLHDQQQIIVLSNDKIKAIIPFFVKLLIR